MLTNHQNVLNSGDWSKLFADLETQGNVPSASGETIDEVHAVFQSMYLDLGDIKKKITESNFAPPLVTIYADVLNIPAGLSWLLQSAVLMVVARRVQAKDAVSVVLDYRTSQTASLVLFANEIVGAIVAVATTQREGITGEKFTLSSAPAQGGIQILYKDNAPAEVVLTRAKGMSMQPTETFQRALTTEFIFSSLLYDQQPSIALEMLTWLKDWSAESTDLLGMFLRSSSLVSLLSSQINAKSNGAAFVPYLTQQVYTDLAKAFVEETRQYESDYNSLSTVKVLTEEGIKLAQTLLDNQTSKSQYVAQLLLQAKSNYDNAVAASEAARKNFKAAQLKAQFAKTDFENIGIPEWEREKILKAVVSLATAVITFGVGIAGMLVGDEAAGPAAAAAAVTTVETVEKAAEAGSAIAKMAKELSDVMKQLKQMIESLEKVVEFSKQVVAAAQNIENAQSFVKDMQSMDIATGGADLTATYQWQVYQITADATIQDPIDQGVGYAAELKLAIDEVAIYGQALAAAQLAEVTAGQV